MPRQTRRHRPLTVATVAGICSLIIPALSMIRSFDSRGLKFVLGYTAIMSGITFLVYGYDKIQSRNLEWRVKETTLHTLALLGGWPGALAGMHYFQHKTRKGTFQVPFWIIIMAWQVVWFALWKYQSVVMVEYPREILY
ncbi:DUF1294-domain-containing protein [Corynespora cassiicola Philippines]|uniref:DUF1294-domain-containing protein n=1 Tax=Corynespora cassiicola Philippines TaxID=1448308 RepID=A0A2T2ND88_CORCC|nr:DUF1294-domain-containing protein [Corynespora cassiicola Philippines]